MAIRKEIIDSFQKDIDRKKQRIRDGTYIQARETYIRNKKRGDYSIVVDEWDKFELERDLKNKKIKGEIMMSDRRVLVRLSKAFNNVEVEVNNILTPDEFDREMVWAKQKSFELIDMLPNEKIDSYLTKPNNQVKATPTEYVKAVQNQSKPANGVYTRAHITTKFLKGRQWDYAIKGLNDGKIDLDALNNASSWEESNSLVFPKK